MSGDAHAAGGAGGKLAGFGGGLLTVALGIVAVAFAVRFVMWAFFEYPFWPTTAYVAPSGYNSLVQSPAGVQSHGAPAPAPRANDGSCRPVQAVTVRNEMCRRNPGDLQMSWQGKTNYCLPAKPSSLSVPCINPNGMMSWLNP